MARPQRIDETFTDRNYGQVYNAKLQRQTQATEQPVANTNRSIRNANVAYIDDRRGGRATPARPQNPYPDSATVFNENYARAGLQPSNIQTDTASGRGAHANKNVRGARVTHITPEVYEAPSSIPRVVRIKKPKEEPNVARREFSRARATSINAWVIGSSTMLFLPILVLSVASVFFFGLAYYVETLFSEAPAADTDSGLIEATINGATEFFRTIGQFVATKLFEFFGIDIIELPMQMFMITYATGVGIGLILLLLMFLIYSMSFIKCLSGSHAGTKQIAFIIALIGHSIPLMNLFPWFLIWATAVWMYPK